MLRSTALAAILFALPLAPAMAQNTSTAAQPAKISAAGEWNGKLTTPLRTSHLGVSIKETAPGQLTGTIGSHESGVWGTALADITRAGDALSFRVPTTNGKFDGKWDPAASAWTGTYTNPAGTFPLTLAQGPVPPLPTITALNGRWEGALSVGIELKIVLRTKTDEHGTSMLMDSPTQGANGIPVAKLAKDAQAVAFEVPSIRGRYTGTLSEDGATLTGTWNQAMDMPLTLTRVSMDASVPEARRPQTPKAPFPYKVEEVGYDNPKAAGVHLGCTLTTPQTGGPHPAALLITGSGPQDRDETLMGHQIFGVLADHLTRKGIAVLRCDDRGVGKSTGVFLNATPTDFATDAEAGVAFLRKRPDIDPKRIGLIGHSEGSVTGPKVVLANPDVAFLVMMGGLGAKGVDVMTEQRTLITMAMGLPPEQEPMIRMSSSLLLNAAINGPDEAAANEAVANLLVVASMGAMTQDQAKETAKEFTSPYMRDLLNYDPAPVLSKITIPVLAITGEKDLQVPAKQNLPLIKSLMANNPDVTTIEVPNLNHIFQTARTGAPSEYGEIEESFAPAALDEISNWIVKRMKP